MKQVIALVAIVIMIAWCGAATAGVNYEEVAQRLRAIADGTIPLQNAPAGDTSLVTVLVESDTVLAGETATVGVYIGNNVPLQLFCIPFIVRSIDPGAYITSLSGAYNPNSRIDGWMKGTHNDTVYWYPIINTYPTYLPGTPPYRTVYDRPMFANPPAPPDYESPDGLLFARGSLTRDNALPPGSDGVPGDGEPLMTITFTANMTCGQFEIDTCVAAPTNTITFCSWSTPARRTPLTFAKGIVTIEGECEQIVADPPRDTVVVDLPQDTIVAEIPADTLPLADSTIIVEEPPLDSFSIGGSPGDADNSNDVRGPSSSSKTAAQVGNYPNPFNSSTTIRYSLDGARRVAVVIYDMLGRTVATLVDEYQSPGDYLIPWDGRDTYGHAVPAGIYFYRVQKGDFKMMGKMVLLK